MAFLNSDEEDIGLEPYQFEPEPQGNYIEITQLQVSFLNNDIVSFTEGEKLK